MSSRQKNLQSCSKISDLSLWPRGLREYVLHPHTEAPPKGACGSIPHSLILPLVSIISGQVLLLLKTQSWVISTRRSTTGRSTLFALGSNLPSAAVARKQPFCAIPWSARNLPQGRHQLPFKHFTAAGFIRMWSYRAALRGKQKLKHN